MDRMLDILISLVILFVVVGSRFNKWPAEQSKLFTGKPSDYIDDLRYRGFCLVYILTFFVITVVLYSFPEFLKFFPGAEDQDITLTYTMCSILVVSVLAQQKISAYDEQWRQKLHEWARIPLSVEEVSRGIILSDNFMPTKGYLLALQKDMQRADNSLQRWIAAINNIDEEKANHSIDWSYLKCACLSLIARDICNGPSADDLKAKKVRIEELGRLIPFASPSEKEFDLYKNELEDMSRYFVECLCKYLIKKYPRNDEQYSAFKNFGFVISQRDSTEVSVRDAIVWCVFGVILISVCSVVLLLTILDVRSSVDFLTPDRFFTWSIGGSVAFIIAIFVGLLVKKMPSRRLRNGIYTYLITLLLATLASFIYFQVARSLSEQSANLPYARFLVAMSYSTLSIVVLKALCNTSNDRRDVIISSLFHGLNLGIVMAILQGLITIAFTWDRFQAPESMIDLFMREDWKVMMICLVGFLKGFFVGAGISYVIQEIQRKQLLEALRQNPRVDQVLAMKLTKGEREFNINTRDISKNGAMIQCREKFASGEKVAMKSPVLGNIEGVVKWSRSLFWGRQVAGIEFTSTPSKLHKHLRDRHGEYYA
jgi:hypothetical protein